MNRRAVGDVFSTAFMISALGFAIHAILVIAGVFMVSWKMAIWCLSAFVTGAVVEFTEHTGIWGKD